ncbi:unnamed protein product [Closterium sp. NIES-54]
MAQHAPSPCTLQLFHQPSAPLHIYIHLPQPLPTLPRPFLLHHLPHRHLPPRRLPLPLPLPPGAPAPPLPPCALPLAHAWGERCQMP